MLHYDPGSTHANKLVDWRAFSEHYTLAIYRWCRLSKLQEADAWDVTNNLVIHLRGGFPRFKHTGRKGSFRAYLYWAVRNAIADFHRDEGRLRRRNEELGRFLAMVAVQEDGESQESWRRDLERKRKIMREAMARVERQLHAEKKGWQWDLFRLTFIEGQRAGEIASRFELTSDQASVVKYRVGIRIKRECKRICRPE